MNIVSIFVVFSVTWFLALYCLLPIGVRSQEEAGEEVPEGAMTGAPANPNFRKKAIGATIISAIITAILYYIFEERIITLDKLDQFFGLES